MSKTVVLSGLYLYFESDLAIKVGYDEEDSKEDGDSFWIPKSQIIDRELEEIGDHGIVEVTRWFAEKNGLE